MAKVNIVMDTSQYDMFRLCEARFNYRYNLCKDAPIKKKQLDRGTLVHLGCETYYQCLKDGAKYDYAVNASLMKIKEAGVIESDLESEEITRIVSVMEEYFDYWRVTDQNFRVHEVESAFMYLLYEDDEVRIYMSGKIDLIYGDHKHDKMPMDHKSFERSYEVNRLGNQFKNYCIASSSNFLVVNKIGFQKTLKPEQKYLRVPISYDPILLGDWKDNVVKVLFHYLDCVATGYWPMNETSCDKFNRRCEYYEVCDSSGREAKEFKLNNLFITVDPWDVTKVLRKGSEILAEEKERKEKENVT